MNTNSEIPEAFREAVFPDYVRIATANAVIGAQYVERVLNAICLVLQTRGLKFSLEDFMSGDASRTRQTLGRIQKQLRETRLFNQSFSNRLLRFSRGRNRVVHGLFVDSFKSEGEITIRSPKAQAYVKECEDLARDAAQLVEAGFGIYRVLGEILFRSNPNDPKLVALLRDFDEYHEIGLRMMDAGLKPHLAPIR
jgi:hypothetical protein